MTKRQPAAIDPSASVVVNPGPTDVLFGRGGHVNHNPANQRYLTLVMERKEQYNNCKKTDKASIAWDIMAELRQQDPPTRFLKKDYSTGLWHVVKDTDVRRKISQCLRERMVPVIPKKKNKKKRRTSAKKENDTVTGVAPAPMRATRSSTRIQIRRTKDYAESEAEEHGPESTTETVEGVLPDEETPEEEFFDASEEQTTENCLGAVTVKEEESDEAEDAAPPPLPTRAEPVRKRSSYYSLTTGTWQEYNPKTGTWEETAKPKQQTGSPEDQLAVLPPPPPPMPNRAPLKSEESNNRTWSDYFASSLASFTSTPSIFDFSGGDNAWENLLDPSALPQLDPSSLPRLMPYEDDEDSCLGSHSSTSSEEQHPERVVVHEPSKKRTVISCNKSSTIGEVPSKKIKLEAPDTTSVDAFFDTEQMDLGLGKVLEQSRSLSLSPTGV